MASVTAFTVTSTHAPASESLPRNTLHLLCARADTSASVNLITIITSVAGVIIAIIGLILGYIYWKHPRKAGSLDIKSSPIPGDHPSPLPGSMNVNHLHALWLAFLLQCIASVTPTPTPSEHESDPELGRVSTLNSEPDITVEPELANTGGSRVGAQL